MSFWKLIGATLFCASGISASVFTTWQTLDTAPLSFTGVNGGTSSTTQVIVLEPSRLSFSAGPNLQQTPICTTLTCATGTMASYTFAEVSGQYGLRDYSQLDLCSNAGCSGFYTDFFRPFTYPNIADFGPGTYNLTESISNSSREAALPVSDTLYVSISVVSGSISDTPEPGTVALFGSGGVALFIRQLRKRKRA